MAALCQVVDEKDEIIGYKERHDFDFNKDIYRIAALWLTNSKGQVLIAQRLKTKDRDPGMWGMAAGGNVEQGETYETNIYKEAEEEIGLTDVQLTIGPKVYLDKPRKAFLQWFTGSCDWPVSKFIPQATEVEQVKWVSRNWLEKDVAKHPEKYVPSMPTHLQTIPS